MNERIKKLRESLSLTQREFALRIGRQPNTVATYEMGIRTPNEATILIISRTFNVNEDWLKTGNGDMFLQNGNQPCLPTINSRVREVRIHFGLSMEKFGNRIGVQRSSICNIEGSKCSVSNQVFLSICREFNVNEQWLRNGIGNMFAISENNTKKEIIKLLENVPDSKMGFILAYIQGITADNTSTEVIK